MKNLANCKPSEFLKQTSRIRKSVEKWLDITEFSKIRKNTPDLVKVSPDMTVEERAEAFAENKRRTEEQARKNFMRILDAALDKHPDETLEVLALLSFVEPENVDDYPVTDYIKSFTELINNEVVLDFFTSLARLDQLNT
ncbi:MAG: hypothetical protein IJI19_06070 [Ruminococcus sp.]|nr:hypothetical protein [Ruminococcus sp.]